MKTYETDVLVIGGGGAATASTIAAHEQGVRTMLAVKGRFGVPGVRGAGATSNPRADFWTAGVRLARGQARRRSTSRCGSSTAICSTSPR